ncbi:MAG: septum formation protein Maf [Pirellulaceae bacterium]|nr:septum formation protein Maf [Pirellulaceae bacterium]
MRLILASQSPRRRQLLTEAGYQFEVIAPSEGAEDGDPAGDPTSVFVTRLAVQKAADVAMRVTEPALIIACDTVADCDGVVLGKPVDRDHAQSMLRMLSGREHSVWSGLCVWESASGEFEVESARSILHMAELSDQMIEEYLDSGAWLGKSGAFGYQDGLPWLTLQEGTASNVVGLPMDLLANMLKNFAPL